MCVCCGYLRAARSEPGSSRGAGVPAWARCSAGTTPPQRAPAPRGSPQWTWRGPNLRAVEAGVGEDWRLLKDTPSDCCSARRLRPPHSLPNKRYSLHYSSIQTAMCSSAELPSRQRPQLGPEKRSSETCSVGIPAGPAPARRFPDPVPRHRRSTLEQHTLS